MSLATLLSSLEPQLSQKTQILTDPSSEAFKERNERWSEENVQVPGAIILPATHADVATIVKFAHQNSIAFVPASGGHSPWSTIPNPGFILDLSLLNSITLSTKKQLVTISGAVLVKELATVLEKSGQCATLGNGNTVGVLPYVLSGGTSILTATHGYACDQLTSIKLVTATGETIKANAHSHPDLFWALKGAGTFFGVVLEITMKTFPLSILGSEDGSHWAGTFIYTLDKGEEVCKMLEPMMIDQTYNTAGSIMVIAPPPAFQPVLLVAPHFLGDSEEAAGVYQALSDLGPVMTSSSTPKFSKYRDTLDYACAKGDFKNFSMVGVPQFETANFLKVIELFQELVSTCPDAVGSGYIFEWHTSTSKPAVGDSAFPHKDVLLWMNTLSWYTSPMHHSLVKSFSNRALAAMRSNQSPHEFIDYGSVIRSNPVSRRFPGVERLAKLKSVKAKWDPEGVFTREFL